MIVNEFAYTLKDGRRVTISSPKDEDIPSMIEMLYLASQESDFLLMYPEECSKNTPEKEKAIFDRINNSALEVMLLARLNNRVIGCTHLSFGERIKTKHRCFVTITILKECWGQGLGTCLFQKLIEIAKQKEYVTQMELSFVEGNKRAQGLYEKYGFKITAKKPNAIRLKDGNMLCMYEMVKDLTI